MSIVLDVVPRGGHNLRLMALCHSGAFLHSKNNAMFIKHFKPWAEIIRARFFITIFNQTVKGRIVHVHEKKEKKHVEQIWYSVS